MTQINLNAHIKILKTTIQNYYCTFKQNIQKKKIKNQKERALFEVKSFFLNNNVLKIICRTPRAWKRIY